ncbi:MAG: hypothetical protein EZS28_040776 [Streblomastix strix]|uniref:Uncharacterized protein n=1 Tax=Streblomastix strix TaxID=222440 RepID=A0A5J4TZI6_9EUKA|nr:MAG: hypothetical protein EZS28_040776 [Streblomastix strix]
MENYRSVERCIAVNFDRNVCKQAHIGQISCNNNIGTFVEAQDRCEAISSFSHETNHENEAGQLDNHRNSTSVDIEGPLFPQFDGAVVADSVIEFAAFCVSRVISTTSRNRMMKCRQSEKKHHSDRKLNYSESKQLEINENQVQSDAGISSEIEESAKYDEYSNFSVDKQIENEIIEKDADEEENTRVGIVYLLKRMKRAAGLRTTELLQALALIDTISRQSQIDGIFELNKNNIYMVMLVCVMIAHKSSCDKPFSNGWWGRQFGAALPTLNESEVVILKLLNHNTSVSVPTFERYRKAIVLAEPQMSDNHF